MPSSRTVSASARRRCGVELVELVLRKFVERVHQVHSSAGDRQASANGGTQKARRNADWYARRHRSHLAALYPDEDGCAAAAGRAHAGCRIVLADGRELIDGIASLVDRLPRLQPPAHPRRRSSASSPNAACDVRRAGARAGADAGAAARGAAAGRSRPRVLFRFGSVAVEVAHEDGGAISGSTAACAGARNSSPSRAAITATPPARWR